MSVLRVRDPLADGDVDVEEEVPEGVLKTPSAITAAKWDTSPGWSSVFDLLSIS